MEPNEQTLAQLGELLAQGLSADTKVLKATHAKLTELAEQPGFGPCLLKFVCMQSSPLPVRQMGAVFFKNMVTKEWGEDNNIPEQDRTVIRDNLITGIFESPAIIRSQLTEAVSQIALHDFPDRWQGLLPSLLARLQTEDFHVIVGVLHVMYSIFKRYPDLFRTDELFTEILYVVKALAGPLVQLYQATARYMESLGNDPQKLTVVLEAMYLLNRIFYCLTYQDLPEAFEDSIKDWMPISVQLLGYKNAALDTDDDDEPSIITKIHTSVCKLIWLFVQKYDEEFAPFLQQSVETVWSTIMSTGPQPKHDQLVVAAIGILTVIASGHNHSIFNQGIIQQLSERVIIPNIQCREADIELFEDNPMEYIRQHIEGSDTDTRRRAAADLVRALTAKFAGVATQIFTQAITTMLDAYKKNPAQQWPVKDAAVYLVIALTATTQTERHGATSTNELVPLAEFFNTHLMPEIQSSTPPSPILQADAIKYMAVFRKQLPKQAVIAVLPNIVNMLTSPSIVLHSYASHFLDRLLTVRVNNQRIVSDADLAPQLGNLLTHLFNLINNFQENDYVMRAVMRVITTAHAQMGQHVETCLTSLTAILMRIAKNPSNPGFTHYLFETIAALVKLVTATNPAAVEQFKTFLFPPFTELLQGEVTEFMPYVFQILAQLLEKSSELGDGFRAIFPSLTSATLWMHVGNAPPLVRMLVGYMSKAPELVVPQLNAILGVFQRLVSRSDSDTFGFLLLRGITKHLPVEAWKGNLNAVYGIVFQRLQTIKERFAPRYTRSMMLWMSDMVMKFGPDFLVESVDSLQPKLFYNILTTKWMNTLKTFNDQYERKLVAAAMIKLITESQSMRNENYLQVWGPTVHATLVLIDPSAVTQEKKAGGTLGGVDTAPEEHDGVDEALEASTGYGAVYSRLHYAADDSDNDPLPGVDTAAALKQGVQSVQKASSPDVLQRLMAPLSEAERNNLAQLLN